MCWATNREPSLAQKVGKHCALILSTFKHYADEVGKTNWEEIQRLVVRDYTHANADPTKRRRVVIMPLVRPEPDVNKFAQGLLRLVDRDLEGRDRAV